MGRKLLQVGDLPTRGRDAFQNSSNVDNLSLDPLVEEREGLPSNDSMSSGRRRLLGR